MASDKTLFHLPMDEVRSTAAPIRSAALEHLGGLAGSAIEHGNLTTVHDSQMGTCFHFNGKEDFIQLSDLEQADLSNGFTICLWVKFDEWGPDQFQGFFSLRLSQIDLIGLQRILHTEISISELLFFLNRELKENRPAIIRQEGNIQSNIWEHYTIKVSGPEQASCEVFIDGKKVLSKPVASNTYQSEIIDGTIGKSLGFSDQVGYFKGKMSHFRFYTRPLDPSQIRGVMQQDLKGMAQVRETSMLQVDMHTVIGGDPKPIIFVESDQAGHPLESNLTNPHVTPVKFLDAEETPSERNYHVQWRFRRNVISQKFYDDHTTTQKISLPGASGAVEKWQYVVGTTVDNREDYISFVRDPKHGSLSLASGEAQLIRLPNFNAEARGGSRNTRVEIRFKTETQQQGSVLRHLEIQSHLGWKTIPLIARVKGSNTMLNDGAKSNELTIEISCMKATQDVHLHHDPTNPEKNSRFTLIIDHEVFGNAKGKAFQTETPNGLSLTVPNASTVVNATTTFDGLNPQPEKEGTEHVVFTFDTQKQGLKVTPEKPILIEISELISNAKNGTYNLLLRYEDIPGYWDGAWVIPVELSPLVIRNNNVGFGIDDPLEKAHVEGNMLIDGQLLIGDKDKYDFALKAFQKEYEKKENEPAIIFAPDHGKDDHAWLRFHSRSGSAHNLEIQVNQKGKGYLALNPQGGDIVIGKEDTKLPNLDNHKELKKTEANVHVNGRVHDKTGLLMPVGSIIAYGGEKAPQGWLMCNGKEFKGDVYPELKSVLGRTTVPDLRDRFIAGAGNDYKLGHKDGKATHTLTIDEMPKHTHDGKTNDDGKHHHDQVRDKRLEDDFGSGDKSFDALGSGKETDKNSGKLTDEGSRHHHRFTTNARGGSKPHNNLPPFYALYYIIKC